MYVIGVLLSAATVFVKENFQQNKTKVFNGTAARPKPVILQGYEGAFRQFPHAARLYSFRYERATTCTTEIIHSILVITAAHCVNYDYTKMYVVAGDNNQDDYIVGQINPKYSEYEVVKTFIHPLFNSYSMAHDVAILKVNKPMSHKGVELLPLSYDRLESTEQATTYGWGGAPGVTNNRLFAKNLTVRPCKEKLEDDFEYICLIDHGVELGDSGGPVIVRGELRGVCSHKATVTRSDGKELVENYLFTPLFQEKKFLEWVLHKSRANYNRCFLLSIIMSFIFVV